MATNNTQTGRTDTTAISSVPLQSAEGISVFDSTSITATDSARYACGFKPKYVCFVNLTDRVQGEWYEGMTTSQLLLTVAAGTRTLDTTASAIVVDDRGFSVLQNDTLGLIKASKTCVWRATA